MADKITLDTLYSSVRQLGDLLRTRRIRSVDLTRAYLDRLAKLSPRLGAVVTLMRERALAEARQADKEIAGGHYRGPLHGIPYGAKDLLAAKGAPTTWGAEPYRKQVFDRDATVVRKLNAAGAVLLGKLAMVELAGGFGYDNADASFTGPCRTPWNRDYWSGGSSSGSGAATAAALVAFAIGSETNGSIVTPSAFCGVSGLRPTYGRVSRHGAMALCWTLDKIGPMCRTADDCGLVLSAIAGRDRLDPSSQARPFSYPGLPRGKKLRLGVLEGATEDVQPEVKKNFETALAVLGKFADLVEDVELPDQPDSDVFDLIFAAEAGSAFRDLLESGEARKLRAVNKRGGGYAAQAVLAVDYLQAMRVREPLKRALHAVHARFDALVAPARGTVAYPIGTRFHRAYPRHGGAAIGRLITAGNLAGLPAVIVPTGLGHKGLPTAIQFSGRAWSEARLLAIARAYQEKTDWHRKRPPEPK
jgi:aspartyl-tRNA(Asn)/glutamyl-tRNA(Gln) amidotransferase subunit A